MAQCNGFVKIIQVLMTQQSQEKLFLIAVAVNSNSGNLVNQNSLIGDAFVWEGRYVGN